MRKNAVLLLILSLIWFNSIMPAFIAPATYAGLSEESLLRILDVSVQRVLQSYNEEDPDKFASVYPDSYFYIGAGKYFENVFIKTYKKDLGRFRSRELIEAESGFDEDFPFLVYDSVFENHSRVKIKVSFTEENGLYKISSLQFDKAY